MNQRTNLPTPAADPITAVQTLVANATGHVDRLVGDVCRDARAVADSGTALWRAAERQVLGVRRGTPRVARVVREAASLLASHRLLAWKTAFLSPEGAEAERAAAYRRMGQRVHDLCCELGGGLLKVGQLLSVRADLLPLAFVEPLRGLQDAVPPAPWPEVVALLEADLGAPIDQLFVTIDEAPIAAASLAQVHDATLPDGRRVAVKVQRPGVADLIDADVAAIELVGGLLDDAFPGADVRTIAREVAADLRGELDFAAEGANLVRFGAAFADDPGIVVPEVVDAATTPRVLTMTHLDGARLNPWLADASPDERAALLARMIDCAARQVLEHGVVHADPHPGNFLVLPGPRLAVLDFGAFAVLDPDVSLAYAEVLGALLGRDARRVGALFARMGFRVHGDADQARLEALAADVIERFFVPGGWDLATLDAMEQVEQGRAMMAAHPGITVPPELVAIGRVLITLGGLMLEHRPPIDLARTLLPHVARAAARAHMASVRSR